jgi:type VI secretion system VasD/TssJ family lipoprotein
MMVFLCACASDKGASEEVTRTSEDPQPEEWPYKKNGIRLIFIADSKLNSSDGIAHTLHICAYQLRDPNAFNQLTSDQDGLLQLLECFPFDSSVTSFKELIVQPGQTLSVALDRAEGSEYVGIATGYAKVEKERIIIFRQIPVDVKRKGLLWRTKYAEPADLHLKIKLGSQQIESVEVIQ